MAAVINLNILNFFKLKELNYTTNNIRFNTVTVEKSQSDDLPKERVIDVTPFSRVIADANELESDESPPALIDYRQPRSRPYYSSSRDAYNRAGKSVKYTYPKGLHVDLYA
jgi:hypothetical protein